MLLTIVRKMAEYFVRFGFWICPRGMQKRFIMWCLNTATKMMVYMYLKGNYKYRYKMSTLNRLIELTKLKNNLSRVEA